MEDRIAAAQTLLVARARELAHLYALEHEFTGLIETRRQIEQIRRVPQREKQSVDFERMREAAQQEAQVIERQELPALVELLVKAIRNEADE